ncbi:MAG: HEAT repeat domain-containing protein [Bryobacter sp.]|nr:HEAT repeat domain-containing protein [Bryobacter sp.]
MRLCIFLVTASFALGQMKILDRALSPNAAGAALVELRGDSTYSFALSVENSPSEIALRLLCGEKVLRQKTIHSGDLDWATWLGTSGDCALKLAGASGRYRVVIHDYGKTRQTEREPNDNPNQATLAPLNQTILASGDDSAYLPAPSDRRLKPLKEYGAQDEDWYRFEFAGAKPQLVTFQVDFLDRDNLPADISIFRMVDNKPVLYTEGEDPISIPHEVQALPGNKFTTRVLREAGTYYARVVTHHPSYRLRTKTYNLPPYQDPKKAVQTAVDFLMGSGDSWHANTPRRGGILNRVANVHQETSLCVACHVTHFTQRAQLYATRQGYAVHQKNALAFMTERFYNNPRPLFGFEKQGAVWARVISAPANVLGRMSQLLDIYEKEVTGETRDRFHEGVKQYLDIYYKGRKSLPANETNGNQPLVSKYEVAWYAWEVNHDPSLAALIEQDDIADMLDLCYQTLALAAMDRTKYAEKISRNAQRILSLQRPSGQWPMKFGANEKEAEFQTGHALWTLASAGIPREHPQVAKGLAYLLSRQQEFGGWLDPLQSYENFRTPLRETQMAVLALSAYYPAGKREKGWGSTAKQIRAGEEGLLDADTIWDAPSAEVKAALASQLKHPDVFQREAAAEALGRLANPADLEMLLGALGDSSKLVQRAAAWAVRQIYNRHPETSPRPLLSALVKTSPRAAWGATRVFATHFAALSTRPELAQALEAQTKHPNPAVAIQAWKGLWQFWFWTPDAETKSRIEDAFLAGLREPQHPWVERNLREGIYNIADENIRYLYNNWVPLLAEESDQKRVIDGRLAIEARHATKFASFLKTAPDAARKRLLTALTEYDLRRADAYNHEADPTQVAPPIYNRIGNDIEQIVFFGESNTKMAEAILPLTKSKDPELRRLALQAGLMTRNAQFAAVNKAAGAPGTARNQFVELAKQDPEKAENYEVLRAFGALPKRPATAGAAGLSAQRKFEKPDEAYFRGYVQPILEKRGKDGYACVQCHASHAIFNGNYSTALNVVNLEEPEESLILKKPTSTAESEGVVGAKATAHGGGVRFEKDSPEYNTILTWIRGAKP